MRTIQKEAILSRNRSRIRTLLLEAPESAIELLLYAASNDMISFALAIECLPQNLLSHARFRRTLFNQLALKSTSLALDKLLCSQPAFAVSVYRLDPSRPLQDNFTEVLVNLINCGSIDKVKVIYRHRHVPSTLHQNFIDDLRPFRAAFQTQNAELIALIGSKGMIPMDNISTMVESVLLSAAPSVPVLQAALHLLPLDQVFNLFFAHENLHEDAQSALETTIRPFILTKIIESINSHALTRLRRLCALLENINLTTSEKLLTAGVLSKEPQILQELMGIHGIDPYFRSGKILNIIAKSKAQNMLEVLERSNIFMPTRQKASVLLKNRSIPRWMKATLRTWRQNDN